jgi:hypothetical protein
MLIRRRQSQEPVFIITYMVACQVYGHQAKLSSTQHDGERIQCPVVTTQRRDFLDAASSRGAAARLEGIWRNAHRALHKYLRTTQGTRDGKIAEDAPKNQAPVRGCIIFRVRNKMISINKIPTEKQLGIFS